jgi:hypothetical protein
MHEMVVKVAQGDQVVELGCATTGPMLDVMAFGEARLRATGEPAAAIAGFERPLDRRRNRPGLAANVQRRPARIFNDADERAVAAESACRFDSQRRAKRSKVWSGSSGSTC